LESKKENRRSLQKFVHDAKKKTDCFFCGIPEKDEIEKGRAAGAQLKHVVDWLITECAYGKDSLKLKRKELNTHLGNHLNKEGKDDWKGQL
jgi:hypothetical protein